VAFLIGKDCWNGQLCGTNRKEGLFEIEREKFRLKAPSVTLVDKTSRRAIQENLKLQGRFAQSEAGDLDELRRWFIIHGKI